MLSKIVRRAYVLCFSLHDDQLSLDSKCKSWSQERSRNDDEDDLRGDFMIIVISVLTLSPAELPNEREHAFCVVASHRRPFQQSVDEDVENVRFPSIYVRTIILRILSCPCLFLRVTMHVLLEASSCLHAHIYPVHHRRYTHADAKIASAVGDSH